MSKIVKLFQSFDQFGAFSQIQFFNSDEKFKTVYGGILSIVIYSLALIYFLYLMVLWQTQQILPSVTNQSIFNPYLRHQQVNSPLFGFSVEIDEVSEQLSSIEKRGNLYNLNIYSTDVNNCNTKLTSDHRKNDCNSVRSGHDYFDPVCQNLDDQYQTNLNANSFNRSDDTYVEFYVNECDPLIDGNCLSLEDQSTIFGQVNFFWRLTLFTQDIDLQTGATINIPQDHFFSSLRNQNASSYLFDLKIRYATFIIDTGMIASSIQQIQIVQSIQLTVTQNQVKDRVTNQSSLAYLTYSLDREEEIVRVTRPKLGQILAELGSIIQILLFSGIIMNKFNDTILNTEIEEALIKIYFPQIKVFKFKYDWRGRIQNIQYKNKILQKEDFRCVKNFRQSTGKELIQKMNYFHILHDMSRLQIKMQQTEPNYDIIQLQRLGYKMNLPEKFSCQFNQDNQFLEYQDFLNLNQKRRQSLNIIVSTPTLMSPNILDQIPETANNE